VVNCVTRQKLRAKLLSRRLWSLINNKTIVRQSRATAVGRRRRSRGDSEYGVAANRIVAGQSSPARFDTDRNNAGGRATVSRHRSVVDVLRASVSLWRFLCHRMPVVIGLATEKSGLCPNFYALGPS